MYLTTNYNDFIGQKHNETIAPATKIRTTPIDLEKIDSLKKRKAELQDRYRLEKDQIKKDELTKQLKIIDLKIMAAEVR